MTHIIPTSGYKPRYYKPGEDKVILGDHVARMFGVQHARMFRGHPSVTHTFSTRESLDEIGPASESLPRDAVQDMHRCMHFDDDWDKEDGEQEPACHTELSDHFTTAIFTTIVLLLFLIYKVK